MNNRYLSTLVWGTKCQVCLSYEEGVVPVLQNGDRNIYPLLDRFTNDLHVFACQSMICWEEDAQSSYYGSVSTWAGSSIPAL